MASHDTSSLGVKSPKTKELHSFRSFPGVRTRGKHSTRPLFQPERSTASEVKPSPDTVPPASTRPAPYSDSARPIGVLRQGWAEVKTNSRIAPWYIHQWIVLSDDGIRIYKEKTSTPPSKKPNGPVHTIMDTDINSIDVGPVSTLAFAFRALAHAHNHTIEIHAAWGESDPHSHGVGVRSLPTKHNSSTTPPDRRFMIAFKTRAERDAWLEDIRVMVEPVLFLKPGTPKPGERPGEREATEAALRRAGDKGKQRALPELPPLPSLPSVNMNTLSREREMRTTIDISRVHSSPGTPVSPTTPVTPITPVDEPDNLSRPPREREKDEEEGEGDAPPSELRNVRSKATIMTSTTSTHPTSTSTSWSRLPPSSYRLAGNGQVGSTSLGVVAATTRQRTRTVSSFASLANSSTTSLDETSPSLRTRGSVLSVASIRRSRLGKVGEWLGVGRGDDYFAEEDDDRLDDLGEEGYLEGGGLGADNAFGGLGLLPNVSTGQLSLDFERFQPTETLLHPHRPSSRQKRRESRRVSRQEASVSEDGSGTVVAPLSPESGSEWEGDGLGGVEPLDLSGAVCRLGGTPIGGGGGGGLGEVWRGKWTADGTSRAVVIKVIHPSLLFSAPPSSPTPSTSKGVGDPHRAMRHSRQSQLTPALRALLQVWNNTPQEKHILPLWGVVSRPTLSIVNPLMRNGNARDWLDKMDLTHTSGGWQVGRVRRLKTLLQIAQGLEYLHGLKPPIVHGDLKGTNVLINEAGDACLTDFGLVPALCDAAGISASGVSSARWLAYELAAAASPTASVRPSSAKSAPVDAERKQSLEGHHRRPSGSRSHREPSKRGRGSEESEARKRPAASSNPSTPTSPGFHGTFTCESDVWSFGSTMYELLSGRLPYFHRTSDVQVLHEIALGLLPRKSGSGIPHNMWEWLERRCWVQEPSRRADIGEVVFMLDKFVTMTETALEQ